MSGIASPSVPGGATDVDEAKGHWLLAGLGKRVLRPGGVGLTRTLLAGARPEGADVVELAPGLGRTASEIVAAGPRSYVGVDRDPAAIRALTQLLGIRGAVRQGDAAATGLPAASADVVVGEALLTMHGDRDKAAIITEAVRLLRPGGRYAIHELGLAPDSISDQIKTDVRQALARTIRVNARPLTAAEWQALLTSHGLVVDQVEYAPMALLQPRRLLADEGLGGTLRFAGNLLRHRQARRRVLAMRRVFRANRDHLTAVALVAHKPHSDDPER
ncbi:class I SAM-dependent methyltransferase [Ornithinicoccus hortensis]|uniref:Methyltransferase family protein n=1 Tax=Ornithinicoccus hortensis TaxID=82346 RepID=A0A542YVL8_9MICO|nr:class I SAM-dependent methyltransferase [Ornithinicoccus hortensis]TQL52131.1 methyltransferase family protein [Ornithinicoccus hortensis]